VRARKVNQNEGQASTNEARGGTPEGCFGLRRFRATPMGREVSGKLNKTFFLFPKKKGAAPNGGRSGKN